MAHLDKLEITKRVVDAAKRRKKIESSEHRRNKLIANIEEQIELAQMAIRNEPLLLERKRGKRVVNVKPRIWWVAEPDGQVIAQVRYNKIPLNLAGKGTSIHVDQLSDLPDAYDTVILAIRAGELDQAIENAAKLSNPGARFSS